MERGAGRPLTRCSVRTADPTEYDRIIEILTHSFGPQRSKEAIDGFCRSFQEVRQLAFLAMADGEPIGCLVADAGEHVILYNLAVLPDYRHCGVAGVLVETAMEIIRREICPASFWTAVHLERAQGVPRFAGLGFTQVKVEDGYLLMTCPARA